MNEYIKDRLDDQIQDLMLELEKYYNCDGGDVDPWTAYEIDETVITLAKLLARVIRYNQK